MSELKSTKPRYNHALDVAFEVHTDHKADDVTAEEIIAGMKARIAEFEADHRTALQACDVYDTVDYREDEEDEEEEEEED